MIVFYLAILILILTGIKVCKNGYHSDYLSKTNTNAIKGVFLLFIVISHSLVYVTKCGYELNSFGDNIINFIYYRGGQLVVVMFLFYSGYGIGESYKRKGETYVKQMPTHRILTTLLNFDVAVLFFAITCLCLSIPFTTKHFLLSLIAWESIGNSNWYIFCILLCYFISFVTLKFTNNKRNSIIITCVLVIISTFILSLYKGFWWYNTMWAYGAGFAYSIYKEDIESRIQNKYLTYLCFMAILFFLLFVTPYEYRGIKFNVLSIVFALLVTIITMKVTLSNQVLIWIGKNLFPMYIYQRIPMIFLSNKYGVFTGNNPILFVVISIIITVAISYFYKYWKISLK